MLKERYIKINEKMKEFYPKKDYSFVRRQIRFYYDESFFVLNNILSGSNKFKLNVLEEKKFENSDYNFTEYYEKKKSFLLSKLKWFFF